MGRFLNHSNQQTIDTEIRKYPRAIKACPHESVEDRLTFIQAIAKGARTPYE